jgi:hypothetical protein
MFHGLHPLKVGRQFSRLAALRQGAEIPVFIVVQV